MKTFKKVCDWAFAVMAIPAIIIWCVFEVIEELIDEEVCREDFNFKRLANEYGTYFRWYFTYLKNKGIDKLMSKLKNWFTIEL